jgi:hypothetical protein
MKMIAVEMENRGLEKIFVEFYNHQLGSDRDVVRVSYWLSCFLIASVPPPQKRLGLS